MKLLSPQTRFHLSFHLTALLTLALVAAFTLPGCGGCQKETAAQKKKRVEEEKKKKEEKEKKKKLEEPKPNYEPINSQVLPNTVTSRGKSEKDKEKEKTKEDKQDGQMEFSYVKPGHWISVMHTLKANNFDYPGVLRTYPNDINGRPLDIYRTNYRVSMLRPASLPKGQAKFIETTYFLPLRDKTDVQARYNLRVELLSARGGSEAASDSVMGASMGDHEYFIVVLASNSSSYIDWRDPKKMKSVVVNESDIAPGGSLRYYQVMLPKIERRVPVPSNPFAWTAIAYIVWDDLDPAILTKEQQDAMLDWIHWGGQLVISGPNSLDKLKGSFLAPYLPAESGQALKLNQSSFEKLNAAWSLPALKKNPQTAEQRYIKFVGAIPMLGVELKRHPQAQFLEDTGDLVVERRVGGGRIVATAFPLTDLRIRQWPNFDGFLNGCLLRRPGRTFRQAGEALELQMVWADAKVTGFERDPRLACTLRYFTRDVGYPKGQEVPSAISRITPGMDQSPDPAMGYPAPFYQQQRFPTQPVKKTVDEHPQIDDWHFAGYRADTESGVGGWSDFSAASAAARTSLEEAGKISIPKADFVLKVLAIYLVVLVPLNWLLFWLIGRVEWAWAAAPIIAVIGAISVIRLAQLNIGFVRSRTEIAVLETQGDYKRGHVTRYTTLYTSLSTGYDVAFEDPAAVSLPFVTTPDFERKITDTPKYVEYRQDKETTLSGVQVNSNSTEKVHSEHMLSMKGPISLVGDPATGLGVKNGSGFTLHDVGVLRRAEGGKFEAAYVEELRPGTSIQLQFRETPGNASWVPDWDASLVMSPKVQEQEEDKGTVRLYRLVELAAQQLRLAPGDVRLIAWTDDALPGMKVFPAPAQNNTRTLVLSHLARAKLAPAGHDTNIAEDEMTLDAEITPMPDGAETGFGGPPLIPTPTGP